MVVHESRGRGSSERSSASVRALFADPTAYDP
jgi:hypothetical protein